LQRSLEWELEPQPSPALVSVASPVAAPVFAAATVATSGSALDARLIPGDLKACPRISSLSLRRELASASPWLHRGRRGARKKASLDILEPHLTTRRPAPAELLAALHGDAFSVDAPCMLPGQRRHTDSRLSAPHEERNCWFRSSRGKELLVPLLQLHPRSPVSSATESTTPGATGKLSSPVYPASVRRADALILPPTTAARSPWRDCLQLHSEGLLRRSPQQCPPPSSAASTGRPHCDPTQELLH